MYELEIFEKIEFKINIFQNFENISKYFKISKIFQNLKKFDSLKVWILARAKNDRNNLKF